MSTENTCILFFSRTPESEANFKKLHPSKRKNLQLHTFLYRHTLKKIQKSRLSYLIINEEDQKGSSFGERLSNAIDKTFDTYDNVIVLGNDCPNLDTSVITKTLQLLHIGQQVVGKEKDGGTYLLGLKKEYWDKYSFTHLPWNTKDLFSEVLKAFQIDQVSILNQIYIDIDDIRSLLGSIRFAQANSSWSLKAKNLISNKSVNDYTFVYIPDDSIHLSGLKFRGPPLLVN